MPGELPPPSVVTADPDFRTACAGVDVDVRALAIARRAVEDVLVELRDARISVLPQPANGFAIRAADNPEGSAPSVVRLSTAEGLSIGIRAYLAALDVVGRST